MRHKDIILKMMLERNARQRYPAEEERIGATPFHSLENGHVGGNSIFATALKWGSSDSAPHGSTRIATTLTKTSRDVESQSIDGWVMIMMGVYANIIVLTGVFVYQLVVYNFLLFICLCRSPDQLLVACRPTAHIN